MHNAGVCFCWPCSVFCHDGGLTCCSGSNGSRPSNVSCACETPGTHLGKRRPQGYNDDHIIQSGVAPLVSSRVTSRAVLHAHGTKQG